MASFSVRDRDPGAATGFRASRQRPVRKRPLEEKRSCRDGRGRMWRKGWEVGSGTREASEIKRPNMESFCISH